MILVDTNIWSEATKVSPDATVQGWARDNDQGLWLSCVVLAELRGGAAMLPVGKRRTDLEEQFHRLADIYADRLLSFDEQTTRSYALIVQRAQQVGRPIGTADAMIAATAHQHGLILATRDVNDFAGTGIELLNPWQA